MTKKILLLLVITLIFLGLVAGVLYHRRSKSVQIDASNLDWASAEIVQQDGPWCPPLSFDWSASHIDANFVNNEKISVQITAPGKATINLEPKILEVSESLSQMFNNYELVEGQVLTIMLEDGSNIQIYICGTRLYSSWGKS